MDFEKGRLLYEGKAKKVFEVAGDPTKIWIEYKDSLTAFNAQKKSSFAGKGGVNSRITSKIYKYFAQQGIPTHWIKDLNERESICEKLEMIPLEVVIRNRLAGSTAKKFGIEEGTSIDRPLCEFYYKNDALGDPFISDDQALLLKAVPSQSVLQELKERGFKVNSALKDFFRAVNLELIDFKMEFGRDSKGQIVLGDEISPDTCRLWDLSTGERMDKDRFRRDLGRVEETYFEVLERINKQWGSL
jgi:phosphoribosylaminoimidazole-succinocarboxamide synthase